MKIKYEKIYNGYRKEPKEKKRLISFLMKAEKRDVKDYISKLKQPLNSYDFIRIAKAYKLNNENLNKNLNYLLYLTNQSNIIRKLKNEKADKIILENQKNIEENLKNNVIKTFKKELKKNNKTIALNSVILDDFTMLELDYMTELEILKREKNKDIFYQLNEKYLNEEE